jgi:molybdate transport system regulatory protein
MTLLTRPFSLRGALWMSAGDDVVVDPQRIALLVKIDELGSISRAAKAVGWGYKSAWDAVETMNLVAGKALVAKSVGGRGGGGTRLTDHGRTLVRTFRLVEREHRRFVETLDRDAAGLADETLLSRRTSMKTSARNQLPGRVVALTDGAVHDEVEIDVGGHQRVVATVTRGSREALGLAIGVEVFALVKASSILLAMDSGKARFSTRNQISGRIRRIVSGAVNAEVVLDLPQGGHLVASITQASAKALKLTEGEVVSALFKASSVILAVAVHGER